MSDPVPVEGSEPLNEPAPNELLPGNEPSVHPKHSRWITGQGPEGYVRKSAVEGVVLPPIGDTSVQSVFEHGRYLTFVDMPHGQLSKMAARRERQLAEAIAQRDAAQRQNSIVNAENQRIREAGRTRITELEAALATERARNRTVDYDTTVAERSINL